MTGKPFLLVVFFLFSLLGSATATSIFQLLQQAALAEDDAVEVVLELSMDSVYTKSTEPIQALLQFADITGAVQYWPLQVEVRGKFRRRSCDFPPLKFNFKKKQLAAGGLERAFDKLKLVTPCFDDDASQELILKEYLAYRLYNQLSTASFRVQLLAITYRDSEGKYPDMRRYAFVIEDKDELADRLGGVKLKEAMGLGPEQLDRRAETTQALFAYFISNTDWSIASGHNMEMIQLPNGTIIPVPYDFDFSAMVNASYATPSNSVGQYSLQQRVYLGFQVGDELLEEVIAAFFKKRKDFNKTVKQMKFLSGSKRLEVNTFLSGFYDEIDFVQRNRLRGQSLFSALRGEQMQIVPPGAQAEYYGVSSK